MKLLLLSDEKPGHLTSSRGIAHCLPETVVDEFPIHFRSKRRDNRLRVLARLTSWASPADARMDRWLRSALTPECYTALLEHHGIDAVLSTGSSIAAVNLFWARILGVPSLVCRRPSPLGIRHFDKVILPRYQWPHRPRENVIQTLGIPNQITPLLLAGYRPKEKQVPCFGVFIGGDDPYFTITPEMAEAYAQALLRAAESLGVVFAITTSRRTPPPIEQVLIERLAHHGHCLLFAPVHVAPETIPVGYDGDQPVPTIMGVSDVLVVTEDSYSMICEALSSSRPVVVLQTDRRRRSAFAKRPILPKRQQDYRVMAQDHCLLFADVDHLERQIEEAFTLGWPQPPLRDAEHAAQQIAEWLPG